MSTIENRDELLTDLVRAITHYEKTVLGEEIQQLQERNVDAGGDPLGFLLGGVYYSPYQVARGQQKKPLHFSLMEDDNVLLAQLRDFDRDTKGLHQGLNVLLRKCETMQDVRDALPDLCKGLLPGLPATRTRDPGWTLADKPLQFDGYRHTESLIVHFLSSRILN